MAQKTTIMNVNVEEEDEVNFVKDARARLSACFKCGEMGHFQHDCQYNGDKPSDSQVQGQTALDSYDPVIGKRMTNLVATTPITAKAMQSLIIELNRQKELKRTYRRRYKDLQTVTTTTTIPPVTSQPPINAMNTKTSANSSTLKSSLSQGKKILEKGKNTKPVDKGKNMLLSQHQALWLQLQLALLSISETATMIQELTEELQSIDQESLNDE